MKIRRRNHPMQNGRKSAPPVTHSGKRIPAGIMSRSTTQFYNSNGDLVDTDKLQAQVVKNTKLHEEMCRLSGVPTWKLLKQQMENFVGAGPIASDRVPCAFNSMMKAQGKKVRLAELE